jgi:putative OPT family oligopeptide transporter
MHANAGQRALTVRAVVTGMILGGLLSVSNVYVGLRIGWSVGVSITAAVLGVTIGRGLDRLRPGRPKTTILENVMVQTCAGAAGYMASSGLNSAVPALFMLRAKGTIATPLPSAFELVLWISAMSVLGILVAAWLRPTILADERARFPSGTACAETLEAMHQDQLTAGTRVKVLAAAALVGGVTKVAVGTRRFPLGVFGLGIPSSAVLVGVGALVGMRVGATMLATSLLEVLAVGPWLVHHDVLRVFTDAGHSAGATTWAAWSAAATHDGAIAVKDAAGLGAALRTRWSIWPGTATLVGASLGELVVMRRVLARSVRSFGQGSLGLVVATIGTFVACISLARLIFGVSLKAGLFAGSLSVLFAAVATRATGETDVSPAGPLGKVTQLALAFIAPGDATANLMGANLMTGTAAHASELMTDLKTGSLLGASPRHQVTAQLFGILAGAGLCVPAFLAIARTSEIGGPLLPAPAAVAWRAMAEFLSGQDRQLPRFAMEASLVMGAVAFVLALLHASGPSVRRWLPSPTAMGIALVIDAQDSVTIFLGAALAAAWALLRKESFSRHGTGVASGLIAGEALAGVVMALWAARGLA